MGNVRGWSWSSEKEVADIRDSLACVYLLPKRVYGQLPSAVTYRSTSDWLICLRCGANLAARQASSTFLAPTFLFYTLAFQDNRRSAANCSRTHRNRNSLLACRCEHIIHIRLLLLNSLFAKSYSYLPTCETKYPRLNLYCHKVPPNANALLPY